MTFVRRRDLSRRVAGDHRNLQTGHFRIGYGARSRHLLLLYTG